MAQSILTPRRFDYVPGVAFTALHQALGRQPGPIDSEMLDQAIAVGVEESEAIDWKREPPAEKDLAQSDVVKDIAAFANWAVECSDSASPRTTARQLGASTSGR